MAIIYKPLEEMLSYMGGGKKVRSDTLIPKDPLRPVQSEFLNSMNERGMDKEFDWLIFYESHINDWIEKQKFPIQKERVVDTFPNPLETAILIAYVDGYKKNPTKPINIEFYECQESLLIRVHYDADGGEFLTKKMLKYNINDVKYSFEYDLLNAIDDKVSIITTPGKGTDIIIALDYDNKIEVDSRKNWLHAHQLIGMRHLSLVKPEDSKEKPI